jgi:predicted ester cyclase
VPGLNRLGRLYAQDARPSIVSCMTESPSERSVRSYWDDVWSKGNVAATSDFYAPIFRLNGDETSVEEFAKGVEAWLAHFSDFRVEVHKLFVCGSVVVSRVIYRAAHTGDFKTLPRTGKTFELSGIDIFEFRDGFVTAHWHETDHWDMFQQLGAELRPVST